MWAPGNIAQLWFVTHRQAAIARSRGHSLRTPETNVALAVHSSWAFVSLREYNAAGLAEYAHASCINYAKSIAAILSTLKWYFAKCAKRRPRSTATRWNRQWNSLLLTSRCQRRQTQSAHHATMPPQRVHQWPWLGPIEYLTSLFIKALKMTSSSNLHDNSGTVEYFAGQ